MGSLLYGFGDFAPLYALRRMREAISLAYFIFCVIFV